MNDTRYAEQAFDAYKQSHGIHQSRQFGDLTLQQMSEVMQDAQRLKDQEKLCLSRKQ